MSPVCYTIFFSKSTLAQPGTCFIRRKITYPAVAKDHTFRSLRRVFTLRACALWCRLDYIIVRSVISKNRVSYVGWNPASSSELRIRGRGAGSSEIVWVILRMSRTPDASDGGHPPSAIIFCRLSTHPLQVSTNAANSAPSTTRWSALQLAPPFNLLPPCPFLCLFMPHTHFARPIATVQLHFQVLGQDSRNPHPQSRRHWIR